MKFVQHGESGYGRLEIVPEGKIVTEVYIIESESGNGTYRVQLGENGEVHCNCKAFEFSPWPKTCKHIRKIQAERQLDTDPAV